MTDDQREILHDLSKAKVVFQAKTVAAVMGFDPEKMLADMTEPKDAPDISRATTLIMMWEAFKLGVEVGRKGP